MSSENHRNQNQLKFWPRRRRDPQHASGKTLLIISEIVIFTTITICTALIWNNNLNIYGISYFGVNFKSLPIIATGFVIGSIFLNISSSRLPNAPYERLLRFTLKIVAFGILLMLLTPYTVDTFFNWTHMAVGAAIFATEMYAGVYLAFRHSRDLFSRIALLVQFVGGLLAMFSLPDNMLNFMLQGEVIFQFGFMVLINHLLGLPIEEFKSTEAKPAKANSNLWRSTI